MFKETHPIVGTRDILRAIDFYTQRLGFKLAFGDKADPPNYVGFRRDAVELHMQFQFEHEMGTIRLRFLVEDPDALFDEYRQRGVECHPAGLRDTPWGTREFALYDLDRNALTFYRDLTRAEKAQPGNVRRPVTHLELSWHFDARHHLYQWYGRVQIVGGHAVGQWFCVDLDYGRCLWERRLPRANTIRAIADGVIVASEMRSDGPWTADFGVYAIALESGDLLWTSCSLPAHADHRMTPLGLRS